MGRLKAFQVELVGYLKSPSNPISVLAETPTIAMLRGAVIALDVGAAHFKIGPARHYRRLAR